MQNDNQLHNRISKFVKEKLFRNVDRDRFTKRLEGIVDNLKKLPKNVLVDLLGDKYYIDYRVGSGRDTFEITLDNGLKIIILEDNSVYYGDLEINKGVFSKIYHFLPFVKDTISGLGRSVNNKEDDIYYFKNCNYEEIRDEKGIFKCDKGIVENDDTEIRLTTLGNKDDVPYSVNTHALLNILNTLGGLTEGFLGGYITSIFKNIFGAEESEKEELSGFEADKLIGGCVDLLVKEDSSGIESQDKMEQIYRFKSTQHIGNFEQEEKTTSKQERFFMFNLAKFLQALLRLEVISSKRKNAILTDPLLSFRNMPDGKPLGGLGVLTLPNKKYIGALTSTIEKDGNENGKINIKNYKMDIDGVGACLLSFDNGDKFYIIHENGNIQRGVYERKGSKSMYLSRSEIKKYFPTINDNVNINMVNALDKKRYEKMKNSISNTTYDIRVRDFFKDFSVVISIQRDRTVLKENEYRENFKYYYSTIQQRLYSRMAKNNVIIENDNNRFFDFVKSGVNDTDEEELLDNEYGRKKTFLANLNKTNFGKVTKQILQEENNGFYNTNSNNNLYNKEENNEEEKKDYNEEQLIESSQNINNNNGSVVSNDIEGWIEMFKEKRDDIKKIIMKGAEYQANEIMTLRAKHDAYNGIVRDLKLLKLYKQEEDKIAECYDKINAVINNKQPLNNKEEIDRASVTANNLL